MMIIMVMIIIVIMIIPNLVMYSLARVRSLIIVVRSVLTFSYDDDNNRNSRC